MTNFEKYQGSVVAAQQAVDRAAAAYETALRVRDAAFIAAHGNPADGRLSYAQIAAASGLSRGRVIQIVQGESDYSKAQVRE